MITLTLCAVGASYLVVKLLWINQLYPKLFSPLRHIPGPDVCFQLFVCNVGSDITAAWILLHGTILAHLEGGKG